MIAHGGGFTSFGPSTRPDLNQKRNHLIFITSNKPRIVDLFDQRKSPGGWGSRPGPGGITGHAGDRGGPANTIQGLLDDRAVKVY